MKLTFLFQPVRDLKESIAFYRDTFGWEEAWREGDSTVAFALPDSDVQFMIDSSDDESVAGPVFFVESVTAFRAEYPDLKYRFEMEIPGGRWTAFDDPSGNIIYVLDQSTLEDPPAS